MKWVVVVFVRGSAKAEAFLRGNVLRGAVGILQTQSAVLELKVVCLGGSQCSLSSLFEAA